VLELLVNVVILVKEDLLENKAHKELLALLVLLAQRVLLESLETREKQEKVVHKDFKDCQG